MRRTLSVVSAKESAHTDQASHAAVRRFTPPTSRPCSLAPSGTTSLYSRTVCQALRQPLQGSFSEPNSAEPSKDSPKMQVSDVCSLLLLSVVLCLDILMNSEADFIKEISYLAALMRQNCHDASWRME